MKLKLSFVLLCLGTVFFAQAQKEIPLDRVLNTNELVNYIKPSISLQGASEAELAAYFRKAFAERFFYNWETSTARFEEYKKLYDNESKHANRAKDHMDKYPDSTHWQLPFNYKSGKPVNAYALRHLARQHKMVDIAFMYHYSGKDPKYVSYFENQLKSLNDALHNNLFETMDSGNGVYEAFRAGYRSLNWLQIHSLFLGDSTYTDKDQLTTIATLLQHGADLYAHNSKFKSGNHQTRGVSALAMLAIIFRDFEGADLWYQRAMERLTEHLNKEINPDGFQFERSVHYHMSDIGNYFYVYQLAKISNIEIDGVWEQKLKTLFSTLTKITYPSKMSPVLQDDTDIPWAEQNDISGVMTLGYLLFEEPEFGYFAKNKVTSKMYWFLQQEQLNLLNPIQTKQPTYGSLHFPDTGYYIMREGWNKSDKMMVISAGLDDKKPDHQHADMLGVQAVANNQVVLPNYQVRYSLTDFDLFKNSMVKNVALVDNELQGKQWTSNKGGSGFGKFKELPKPKVITWDTNKDFDLFVGSHDGFKNVGVDYTRQVIYVKDDFWVVKDNFTSAEAHTYKQVWQGHYTNEEGPNLIRANFSNASGCDIYQLTTVEGVKTDGSRGKEWSVVNTAKQKDFEFITVIFPYKGYNNRIDETEELPSLKSWEQNKLSFAVQGDEVKSLAKDDKAFIFNVESIKFGNATVQFSIPTDVYVKKEMDNKTTIQIIGSNEVNVKVKKAITVNLNNQLQKGAFKIKSGSVFELLFD